MYDDDPPLMPPGPKLEFKKKTEAPPPPVDRMRAEAERKPNRQERKHRRRVKKKKGGNFLMGSVGTFLLAAIVLGGLLYHQFAKMEILDPQQFVFVRAILVVSLLVVLVIDAFVQDMMQGVIAVFFPPYSLVYGLLFADNGPIRGLTVATLLFLGGELWVTPDDAVVTQVQTKVNEWIQSGQGALSGDRPDAGKLD